MFGLILALLYLGFAVILQNLTPIQAAENTLPFLWWWHITFSVILGIVFLIPQFVGLCAMIAGSGAKERATGLGIIIVGIGLAIVCGMVQALFIGGVYAIDSGIDGGEVVNQTHLILGAVMYAIAVVLQMFSKMTTRFRNTT